VSTPATPSAQFTDGKDAGALRTIGEVAAGLGIKQHILRYWEQQFPMLRPLKRSGGRRYYRAEDVALVETIDKLVNREGFTLKGARKAIESGGAAVDAIAAPRDVGGQTPEPTIAHGTDLAKLLPELKAIRERLAQALAA